MNNHQNHDDRDVAYWAEWNDQMVKKYNSEGTLFESKNPILRIIEIKRVQAIIRFANIKPADVILDIGCGQGFLISTIKQYKKITGLDISRVYLEQAQKRLKNKKNIELIFGDAHQLPFKDKSYNKIISSEVLEHLPDPQKALKEISRVLTDDGTLVISVPDERRIENIMKLIKFLKLNKFLHAARKQETYEWHLHKFDENMVRAICFNLFSIEKIKRIPPLIGYRFVVQLKKIKPNEH